MKGSPDEHLGHGAQDRSPEGGLADVETLIERSPFPLLADLAELKLHRIAELYQEVLNEAACKGSSMLDVLAALVGEEVAVRRQRAPQRHLRRAHLPKRKTLGEYHFTFPKRIPKQAILRLFDCDFVAQHGCAVFIGPTGTGKPQPT